MKLSLQLLRLVSISLFVFANASLAGAQNLQQFLDKTIKEERVAGAVLLVISPKGREFAVAGLADLKLRDAVKENTRFYIASSGKLMTSAVIFQLEQEGKLSLQAKAANLMAPFPGLGRIDHIKSVTVEQLLKHRSGLAEYYGDEFEKAASKDPSKRWNVEESLKFIFDEKANDQPGRAYEYVNTNYVLLGHLIASLDRGTYENSLKGRLFEHLALANTTVGARPSESNLAHGYARNERGQNKDVSQSGWSAITGDGAIVTTASDYAVFLRALFRDQRILQKENVRRMCERQREEPGSDYGLGCMVLKTRGGDAWGHNGSIPGFSAQAWYIPKGDTTIVFFANGDVEADSAEFINEVLSLVARD